MQMSDAGPVPLPSHGAGRISDVVLVRPACL